MNQFKIHACLLFISSFFFVSNTRAQDNLNAIQSSLNQYYQNTIEEKIFVHTDKSFYLTGEIAWFKLYVVNAANNKPLNLSKVAYVEILDSNNKAILRAKIALKEGEGNGSFYLPVNLNSGNYKFRAYTNWMKNFDVSFFFRKNITIVNMQKGLSASAMKPAHQYDIQFFPEGGNLVNNIPSKVAFKGTNEHGRGIDFYGVVLDNNDTLLSFKPQHAGMGSFTFTPLPNHIYKAYIKLYSGDVVLKALPTAYSSGYVLNVVDSADKIKAVVQSDIMSGHEVFLFVHSGDDPKLSLGSFLQDGRATFIIDKAMLGNGISHLTIFNEFHQPVCERLYFKKPEKELEIKLNADQSNYIRRNDVNLNIAVGNNESEKDSVSLSMAVYRLDSLQSNDDPAINSYLLLTGDLKGFVEDPGYYFMKDDAETKIAIDNLLLTNGWRRFKWENLLKNTKPFFAFIPEYNGAVIQAKVINTITGTPANNIETFISVPGFAPDFNSSFSDNDGLVKYELKNVYGTQEIILQPNIRRDSTYKFDYIEPFSDKFSDATLPEFNLHQETANALREESISMQVQNIYSGKNIKLFLKPQVDSIPFYVNADASYLLDNYTRFTTIEEILREYVTLVDVRKREGRVHYDVFDNATSQSFKSDPLVLLDGVPVFDLNKFMTVDPLKLEKLEVLNRKYFLGNSSFNGILSWSSYKGDLADADLGNHVTTIDYDGLQMEREFYSPVYENDAELSSHIPDFRNVLSWSPHIKIATGGSQKIHFYTSDLPGKYLVMIQGISASGIPVVATTTFSVSSRSK
ncbi:MAG: hypothetical protein ABI358_05245 [Ginsengibacter sp.]